MPKIREVRSTRNNMPTPTEITNPQYKYCQKEDAHCICPTCSHFITCQKERSNIEIKAPCKYDNIFRAHNDEHGLSECSAYNKNYKNDNEILRNLMKYEKKEPNFDHKP